MIGEDVIMEGLISYYEQSENDVFVEVPMLSKRIDVVLRRDDNIIAIEAKVKNWKRALQQAISYRLCADAVFIAIWKDFTHRVDRQLLGEYGVGLIEMGEEPRVLVDSQRSWVIHKSVKREVLESTGGPMNEGLKDETVL